MRVSINTRKEYEEARQSGFEPLIDTHFDMNIKLRVELQREIFGKGGNQEANQKFYKWVLAQASPIFHSSCEGKLGIALE